MFQICSKALSFYRVLNLTNKDARYHAFQILDKFEKSGQQLNIIRNSYYKTNSLFERDLNRSLVLSKEVTKWKARLDFWIALNLDKPIAKLHPKALIILRLGYYEVLIDKNVPIHAAVNSWVELSKLVINNNIVKLINAVLRKASSVNPEFKDKSQSIASWYSFQNWMVEGWIRQFGKNNTLKLMDWYNRADYTDLRINSYREKVFSVLDDLKISGEYSPMSNNFIRISSGLAKILKNEYFKKNYISVQDRASGAIVELLNPLPGQVVLDVCAAPGSKSEYIYQKIGQKGKLFSSDSNHLRMMVGKINSKKLNLNIDWSCKDAVKDTFPLADLILIDAPCTGTGAISKKVDIRWRKKFDDLSSISKTQLDILSNMSNFLKKNGAMVYATCSLEYQENWNVVESFLKLNRNFSIEVENLLIPKEWIDSNGCLKTLPNKHNVTGMFAARLRKND